MPRELSQLYDQRLRRYLTALRNEKPDRIPIRPFVAEFTAKYAGFTCQEVTHDYTKAFEAVCTCASDFDWDAVVANMVYVWTGLTQAIGLRYYAVPGIDVPADTGFQYLEPPEGQAFMREDEYDQLIDDPTGFLFNVWLPRAAGDVSARGEATSYRNNLSFLKGGMAMLSYFNAFGPQCERLRTECAMPSAIAGIFKAPFDIIADKLRGYLGLTMDLFERPEKVLAACEALMPHLLHVALSTADPSRQVPIGFWMHRGCVPFVSPEQFKRFYWATLKPIIEELWRNGHQVLFYAEGDWAAHLESFAELPAGSIVYHVDQGDIFEVHRTLGDKFCLSGGIPNAVLGYGTPDDVRRHCKAVIDGVAGEGGYVMDASAIVQNDARIENMQALTDFTREYGAYDGQAYALDLAEPVVPSSSGERLVPDPTPPHLKPGVCIPWADKCRELPPITGDSALVQNVWEDIDGLANMYIWQCLLSF